MAKMFRWRSLGALLLIVVAGVSGLFGYCQLMLSKEREAFAGLRFDEALGRLDRLDRMTAYARHLPGLNDVLSRTIDVRRGEIAYWQKRYADAIGSAHHDKDEAADIRGRQAFISGNALYRKAATTVDRAEALKLVTQALDAYEQTFLAIPGHYNAAFNYELLTRIQQESSKDKKHPFPQNAAVGDKGKKDQQDQGPANGSQGGGNPHGKLGQVPASASQTQMKVRVPAEKDNSTGIEAGKGPRARKKG